MERRRKMALVPHSRASVRLNRVRRFWSGAKKAQKKRRFDEGQRREKSGRRIGGKWRATDVRARAEARELLAGRCFSRAARNAAPRDLQVRPQFATLPTSPR